MGYEVGIILQLAIPFAIWILAGRCLPASEQPSHDFSSNMDFKGLLACYLAFVFVFSLSTSFGRWTYLRSAIPDELFRCLVMLGCTVLAALVVWASKKSYMRLNSIALYRATFLFFVLSLCMGSFFPDQGEISYSMAFVADLLLRTLVFLTIYKICQRSSLSPALLVCITTLIRLTASVIFNIAEARTSPALPQGVLLALFVAALAVIYTVVFTEHHLETLVERRKPRSETFILETKCSTMGKEFRFSKRELEITRYLAVGRTATFIADELFLSPRTVNTHIRNIYKKMGVHSRQEFLSVYQQQRAEPAATFDSGKAAGGDA